MSEPLNGVVCGSIGGGTEIEMQLVGNGKMGP